MPKKLPPDQARSQHPNPKAHLTGGPFSFQCHLKTLTMETPIHTETFQDHTIKIIHDPDPQSPRDYDNLGMMCCWHRRYTLSDKHDHDDPHDLLIELTEIDCDTDHSMKALLARVRKHSVTGSDWSVTMLPLCPATRPWDFSQRSSPGQRGCLYRRTTKMSWGSC